MIADMTDIDYNTSIPALTRASQSGGIDAVVHSGDVAYDIDDQCGASHTMLLNLHVYSLLYVP